MPEIYLMDDVYDDDDAKPDIQNYDVESDEPNKNAYLVTIDKAY